MEGMTISDVAAATEFSPPTIRYYERLGLLPEPRRSESGYRLYDDDTIERLRFISRAKRFGLTLDEIGQLLWYWSEDVCTTTREQLQRLMAAKLKQVQQRIEELRALGAQLEDAYGRLAGHPPQTRCGSACGCPPEVQADEKLRLLQPFRG